MPEVGIVIPAHACALGKALLAFEPHGEVVADMQKLRSMTGDTITDPVVLREQLAAIADTGIATEVEEAVLGECGVAAPLVDSAGEVAGAIEVVVPASEWPPDTRDRRRTALRGSVGVTRARGTAWPAYPARWARSATA